MQQEPLQLTIGDSFFRIGDFRSYSVQAEDQMGYYLCLFQGDCSDVVFVSKIKGMEGFRSLFSRTRAEAAEIAATRLEREAASLRRHIAKTTQECPSPTGSGESNTMADQINQPHLQQTKARFSLSDKTAHLQQMLVNLQQSLANTPLQAKLHTDPSHWPYPAIHIYGFEPTSDAHRQIREIYLSNENGVLRWFSSANEEAVGSDQELMEFVAKWVSYGLSLPALS